MSTSHFDKGEKAMYNICFGCGELAKVLFGGCNKILEEVDFFVDNNVKNFLGRNVNSPKDIFTKHNQNIKLIMMVDNQKLAGEISDELCRLYGIDRNCVIDGKIWFAEMFRNNTELKFEPQHLRVEACSLCQLNCKECYMRRGEGGDTGAGYLAASNFHKIVDLNPNIKSIELSNSGEVFLNPELKGILEIARKKNIEIYMSNGVNLNFLTEDMADALVVNEVKHIVVSIDGASQEVYSSYRLNGNFEKVIENIKMINAKKKLYEKEFPKLTWQYILMNCNECDIEKAITMAEDLNMEISFKLSWGDKFVPTDKDKIEKLTGLKIFDRDIYKEITGNHYKSDICNQLFKAPQINWDGYLFGCCKNLTRCHMVSAFEYPISVLISQEMYKRNMLHVLCYEVKEIDSFCGKCEYR